MCQKALYSTVKLLKQCQRAFICTVQYRCLHNVTVGEHCTVQHSCIKNVGEHCIIQYSCLNIIIKHCTVQFHTMTMTFR